MSASVRVLAAEAAFARVQASGEAAVATQDPGAPVGGASVGGGGGEAALVAARKAFEERSKLYQAGVEAKIVHVPSDLITAYDPEWGAGLLGDKAASIFFDNSKIKRVVPDFVAATPFFKGAREIIAWYDEDEDRRTAGINTALNQRIDRILNGYQAAWPK